MGSGPLGEIARASLSSQTWRVECQRAHGIPSFSIVSVCQCLQSVAGATTSIGLRRPRVSSVCRHNVNAAAPSDTVFPTQTHLVGQQQPDLAVVASAADIRS